jgi:heparinase II/III-like protein
LKRLLNLRDKLHGLTLRQVPAEALLRTHRRVARAIRRAADSRLSAYISGRQLEWALDGRSILDVARRLRNGDSRAVTPGLAHLKSTVETIRRLFPDSAEDARHEAEEILAHRITLFGKQFDLGPQIDWHRDPMSGARWPLEHFTRVLLKPPGAADVRVVWELNRLHHLVALGRAYALSADERYTEEFLDQLAAWHKQNPPRFGVNWTVAMEVAIRAVNVLTAFQLFRDSALITDTTVDLLLRLLVAHGRYIRSNLEFSNRLTSNHYLSDLIGLFVIGSLVPELAESDEWLSFSERALLSEFEKQVLEDGVDYEGAIGYHRFVLEIFALAFTLRRSAGAELEQRFCRRLEAMFDFVLHYLKPDGTAPLIGDSDDGRVIKFKERPGADHSYLLSIGAVLLDSEVFKRASVIDEEAVWWFGAEGADLYSKLSANEAAPRSKAFNDSQIFIQRERGLYAIVDCGDHGAGGYGSHAHSDALSVELFGYGRTLLCDPGTFVYSASERWRNKFRSTAYHNTVQVDGYEISEIIGGQLFALGRNVKPRVISWSSSPQRDVLEVEHDAYTRLPEPVTHRRVVIFEKHDGYWIIADSFTGSGTHRLEFFFNFDLGVSVTLSGLQATVLADRAGLAVVPVSRHPLEARITTRWVSPAYRTRIGASGIMYRLNTKMRFDNEILLIPFEIGNESKIERVLRALARTEP